MKMDLKSKILTSFIVIMILISTIISYNVYADTVTESYINGTGLDNLSTTTYDDGSSKKAIDLNTLKSRWDILCCQRGVHLPGYSDIGYGYLSSYEKGDDEDRNDENEAGSRVSTEELRNYEEIVAEDTPSKYEGKIYKSEKIAYYAIKESKTCTPKAAYILNEAKKNVGPYSSSVQQAWWMTKEGQADGNTQNKGDNDLSKQATAYEKFVKKIAKNKDDVDDPETYKKMKHTYDDGKEVTIKFPEIDSDKMNNMLKFNQKNVTVKFNSDKNRYVIGPFSIKYIESSYKKANGEEVEFGYVDNFQIYTDASEEPLTDEQWDFVWVNENRSDADYPHSNEKFYIEMDYIDNATMITGIDMEYKYLIAGGYYQSLSGTYDEYEWKVKKSVITETDENGNQTKKWKYTMVAKDQNLAKKSQKLALVNEAARWYETEKIELRNKNKKQAKLQIKKVMLDEDGNELTAEQVKAMFGDYQYFNFKVTITHEDGTKEEETVKVTGGSIATTGTYTWGKDEKAPTYEIEEIESNNGWKIDSIEPSTGSLEDNKVIEVSSNNKVEIHKNKIKIHKETTEPAKEDKEFEFEVTIINAEGVDDTVGAKIVIPAGQTEGWWTSEEYKWYGDIAPKFVITEIEDENNKEYHPTITPWKGSLSDSNDEEFTIIEATNDPVTVEHIGYVIVEKNLVDGQISNQDFKFKITVDGTIKGTEEVIATVKAGEKSPEYKFNWNGDNAPKCTVEEIDLSDGTVSNIEVVGSEGWTTDGNKAYGQLVENTVANVNVKFTNNLKEHKGKIKVIKDIETDEKISKETLEEDGTKFDIDLTIDGTFKYDGESYQNKSTVINKTLPDNGKWSFETSEIVWYGEEAPTYSVVENNLPKGWKLKLINYENAEKSDSDTGYIKMTEDKNTVTIVNELPVNIILDLTMKMGGIVWVDKTLDEKNTEDDGYYSQPNGVYDEGEELKENAEVTVYRTVYDDSGNIISRNIATAYADTKNNELNFPIITKSDGKWNVPRISVPARTDEEKENGYSVRYDVEFVYDGETYEPTEFLSYRISKDGTKKRNEGDNKQKADTFKKASTAVKDRYQKDSMALEVYNNSANIQKVEGQTSIDANGETTGFIVLSDGTRKAITYSSDDAGQNYPTHSKVNTVTKEGKVLDEFKAVASTSAGDLLFPVNIADYDKMTLTNFDQKLTENGIEKKYKYKPVYNHCLNINLGLKERESLDVGLTKNLDSAKVVVNEKMYEYKYSGYYDLTETKQSSLDKDIYVADANKDKLSIGLYKTDYYYRAEIYKANDELYKALSDFYNNKIEDTEMDVYLTYKLKLQNTSSHEVIVNSIDDYFDSSLKLVTENESKYLRTKTTKAEGEVEMNQFVEVANASDYANNWKILREEIKGSDGVLYNKMEADNLNIVLKEGEPAKEITITFKVTKSDKQEAKNAIKLGEKSNVAEIASYSLSNGKIDRDSAPGNVNLAAFNEKAWYEDDTFAAPKININLIDENKDRDISGVVWEDNSADQNTENPGYNQQVGNGIRDHKDGIIDSNEFCEKEIADLTTELVEKVIVPTQDGSYKEFSYIWPTDMKLEALNNATIEEITGFDSTITTNSEGAYIFENVPAGDFVGRFTYGDKPIETAKYTEKSKAVYYNGQDFKSTRFRSELKGDAKEITPSSYLDIDKINAEKEVKNTAIDNEVERLKVIDKSREIVYQNSNEMFEMATSGEWKDEYKEYAMFSETPKMDINIEMTAYASDLDNEEIKDYKVNNINCGIEERPITELSLDKQIEQIVLTTSDGNNIMSAKYDIKYVVDKNGKITADVQLDTKTSYGIDNLQALNRDLATNNGFRYINVDSNILEGTTITAIYRFTVLNTGEVDRTGKLDEIAYAENLKSTYDELRNKFETYSKNGNALINSCKIGEYVGNIYYYGVDGGNTDKLVTSTTRQLVDYVDNDVVFDGSLNATTDTSWSNISTQELREIVSQSMFEEDGTIKDSKGVLYETDNRNNLAISVDNDDASKSTNNSGFIVELVPYGALFDENSNNTGYDGQYMASMNLITTRYVGADSDDLQIDNIAEIIKYNNKVGRRDELTIAGNQDPKLALEMKKTPITSNTISSGMEYERDTSATEVITLSPPTGTELATWRLQILGAITGGLAIIAGGIILIKKKVLK